MPRGAKLTLHVLTHLPESMSERKVILQDLAEVLPKGEARLHIHQVLKRLQELEMTIQQAQSELPLLFTK